MSTEAMRETLYPSATGSECMHEDIQATWVAWQAATANQEALIRAALDAAAEVCDDKELITLHPFANVARIKRAIRQITPQQVMERMK